MEPAGRYVRWLLLLSLKELTGDETVPIMTESQDETVLARAPVAVDQPCQLRQVQSSKPLAFVHASSSPVITTLPSRPIGGTGSYNSPVLLP